MMKNTIRSFLTALIFPLIAESASAAPAFVPPAEVVPPFRRDKLPLDTDAMVSLSNTMTLISRSASLAEAPQRRAAAQALGLALALDPTNTSARDVLSSIAKGKNFHAPDPQELTRARTQVWQLRRWLTTPEAGNDGNLLADLLGDAAAALDPEHPSAIVILKSPERGKWDGWVASLPSFEEKNIVKLETSNDAPHPKPIEPKLEQPSFSLTAATVQTVLSAYDKNTDGYVFGNTTVRMKTQTQFDELETHKNLLIEVPCMMEYERDVKDFVVSPMMDALKKSGMTLPEEGRILLQAGDGDVYSFLKNTDSLTGPGYVLAHAALTGTEPDATVLGVIDTKGRLTSPQYLWYVVNELRKGKGGRLVIPADSAEFFAALLTLEEPDFFLKYEVLTASSPAEMAQLCAKKPGDKQAAIFARFEEIKDKAPAPTLGIYLANRFTRQRLLDIHTEMPQHFSAKMLALQGSTERPPRSLPKNVLAAMIWHAIAPIKDATNFEQKGFSSMDSKTMMKLHDEARAELDVLDRFTDRNTAELLERAISLTSAMRTTARAMSIRSVGSSAKYNAIFKSNRTLQDLNKQIRRELLLLTGDPEPENRIERLRKQRGWD